MNKENYLLTLYKEHCKKPFLINRLTMCGGCIDIEKRLYACMEEDLGIICNLNIYKKTNRGRDISRHPKGHEMLLNMCNTINALDRVHTDSMSRGYDGKRFYETNENNDNFLKFIIMYVWDNLGSNFKNREKRVSYFKSIITNKLVLDAIKSMDERYTRSPLCKDMIEIYNNA